MTKFEELQTMHEHLMEQSKAPEDVTGFVADVQREIHNMCVAAEDIPAPRERDQLRAILRFWASYVYDHTDTYPDTTLHPAKIAPPEPPPPKSDHSRQPLLWIALAVAAVIIILLIRVATTEPPTGTPTPLPTAGATEQVTSARPSPFQPAIQWTVLTSGPSPFDATVWVVKLQLSATGGNGNFIFWVNGTRLPDISNNQFTVEGKDCTSEKPIVGVTSGGLATSLELIIQSPLPNCPRP
jgi:hypothetical protein